MSSSGTTAGARVSGGNANGAVGSHDGACGGRASIGMGCVACSRSNKGWVGEAVGTSRSTPSSSGMTSDCRGVSTWACPGKGTRISSRARRRVSAAAITGSGTKASAARRSMASVQALK